MTFLFKSLLQLLLLVSLFMNFTPGFSNSVFTSHALPPFTLPPASHSHCCIHTFPLLLPLSFFAVFPKIFPQPLLSQHARHIFSLTLFTLPFPSPLLHRCFLQFAVLLSVPPFSPPLHSSPPPSSVRGESIVLLTAHLSSAP